MVPSVSKDISDYRVPIQDEASPGASTNVQEIEATVLGLDSVASNKSMLTVVLDLNGLLLKRCQKPSSLYQSLQYGSERYIVLRPRCMEFLKIMLEKFNVGIWSTATDKNVCDILRALQSNAGERLHFFMVWSQESCFTFKGKKLYRPNNPKVPAMFKPLAKVSAFFECDPCKTILIDDSPHKGCVSPSNNCIFPLKFDDEQMGDNMLMDELLPYLLQLDQSEDVCDVISSNRYGQSPKMTNDEYADVIEYWKPINLKWSQSTITTGRLSFAKKLRFLFDTHEESSTTRSIEDEGQRNDIKELLAKEGTNIEKMKGPQLISFARKLGCTSAPLKPLTAKAYIKKVLNEHRLLNLDTNP